MTPPPRDEKEGDATTDRIMRLLDVGLEAIRKGDGNGALMALAEAEQTALTLPPKSDVIALPDKSGERP